MYNFKSLIGLGLSVAATQAGCTATHGHLVPASQFAYPNSNIKALGPTRAEIKKTTWLIQPRLKLAEIKKCYNDALAKVEGANILINYKEDTVFTQYPFSIYSVKYTLDGEAAIQTVGQQDLK